MPTPYLQVDNLTKSFGDHVLFENISFGIAQGQRVGLIAKNGTGKSTLLDILAGNEGYDDGSIIWRNNIRIGYLPQSPTLPDLSKMSDDERLLYTQISTQLGRKSSTVSA